MRGSPEAGEKTGHGWMVSDGEAGVGLGHVYCVADDRHRAVTVVRNKQRVSGTGQEKGSKHLKKKKKNHDKSDVRLFVVGVFVRIFC